MWVLFFTWNHSGIWCVQTAGELHWQHHSFFAEFWRVLWSLDSCLTGKKPPKLLLQALCQYHNIFKQRYQAFAVRPVYGSSAILERLSIFSVCLNILYDETASELKLSSFKKSIYKINCSSHRHLLEMNWLNWTEIEDLIILLLIQNDTILLFDRFLRTKMIDLTIMKIFRAKEGKQQAGDKVNKSSIVY